MPKPVKLFLILAFFLNLVALLCESYARFHLHLDWPYNNPLLFEKTAVDLIGFDLRLSYIHTKMFFGSLPEIPFGYPAPVAFFYEFFYKIPHRLITFVAVSAALAFAEACLFAVSLSRQTRLSRPAAWLVAIGTLLLSYPLAFQIRQGNMEIFVFVVVTAGLWCFASGREHWAATLFAVAVSMKIFPFVYLALFVSRRRFAPLVTAAAVGTAITLGSLYYVCPSISYSAHGVLAALENFQRIITLRIFPQTGFDHSAFAWAKLIANQAGVRVSALPSLLRNYLLCAAVLGTALYLMKIRKLPILNQVLCLWVASILLPPVSFDYTLLNLYAPWAMLVFLSCRASTEQPRGITAAFVCLAILTSIQTELIYRGVVYGGQLKAIVLVVLFIVALRYPFRSSADDRYLETVHA